MSQSSLQSLTGISLPRASALTETFAGGVVIGGRVHGENVRKALSLLFFARAIVNSGSAWAPMPELRTFAGHVYVQGPCEHPSFYAPTIHLVLGAIAETQESRSRDLSKFRLETAIHIRRGDFVSLNRQLGLDYYSRSLTHLQTEIGLKISHVSILGDDEWACLGLARRLSELHADIEFTSESIGTVLGDFVALANAETLIMSNSTLCWWARQYGDSIGSAAISIYPSSEVQNGNPNCQSNWIQV